MACPALTLAIYYDTGTSTRRLAYMSSSDTGRAMLTLTLHLQKQLAQQVIKPYPLFIASEQSRSMPVLAGTHAHTAKRAMRPVSVSLNRVFCA
jgi:hypothetical protein